MTFFSQFLPVFYSLLGLIYVSKVAGVKSLFFLTLQPVTLFALLLLTKSSTVIYLAALALIGFQEQFTWVLEHSYEPTMYRERYIGHVIYAWINARCLSFCLDYLWNEAPRANHVLGDFINMIAHAFYMPVAISGPIINYHVFHAGVRMTRSS